jgi:hypothetical protein
MIKYLLGFYFSQHFKKMGKLKIPKHLYYFAIICYNNLVVNNNDRSLYKQRNETNLE